MNNLWLLVYSTMPILLLAIGYIAVRLHERDSRRHGPAE
jgi:hypothetical protein